MKKHLVSFTIKFLLCTKNMISEVVLNYTLIYCDVQESSQGLSWDNKLFRLYRWESMCSVFYSPVHL